MALEELVRTSEQPVLVTFAMPGGTDICSSQWPDVHEDLKKEYGDDTYKSWISKLHFSGAEHGTVFFKVPTNFIKDWLLTHFEKRIVQIWHRRNAAVTKIYISVDKE